MRENVSTFFNKLESISLVKISLIHSCWTTLFSEPENSRLGEIHANVNPAKRQEHNLIPSCLQSYVTK